jgi:imidazole glycerol phosphate synthase subunit HisF
MKMSKRFEVKVLGTVIGTCDGWDEIGVNHLVFYNFEVNPNFVTLINRSFSSTADSVSINFETGEVEVYQGDYVVWTGNLHLRTS